MPPGPVIGYPVLDEDAGEVAVVPGPESPLSAAEVVAAMLVEGATVFMLLGFVVGTTELVVGLLFPLLEP